MLMGAAALSIKTVIKNIDDYLLKPLGNSLFHWNMQFNNERPVIQGDLDIKAQGTSSLMQKEVRSQRLMTFMQTASNPSLAPFVKWHTCLKEVAKSLDIDPDQLINDPEKAAIYAHIMGMANGNQTNTSNSGQPSPMENMGAQVDVGLQMGLRDFPRCLPFLGNTWRQLILYDLSLLHYVARLLDLWG